MLPKKLFLYYDIKQEGHCIPIDNAWILCGKLEYRHKKSWYISIRMPSIITTTFDDACSFDYIYGHWTPTFQMAGNGLTITDKRWVHILVEKIRSVERNW